MLLCTPYLFLILLIDTVFFWGDWFSKTTVTSISQEPKFISVEFLLSNSCGFFSSSMIVFGFILFPFLKFRSSDAYLISIFILF